HALERLLDELREEHGLLLVRLVGGLRDAEREAVLAAERGERLHVLREARAAVARAGVEELLADARVRADAEAHGVDVRAGRLAEARELVHERDAHREHRVRRVLDELARARIGDDEALARELERHVELAELRARVLAARAEDDAIGLEEVLDGVSLL